MKPITIVDFMKFVRLVGYANTKNAAIHHNAKQVSRVKEEERGRFASLNVNKKIAGKAAKSTRSVISIPDIYVYLDIVNRDQNVYHMMNAVNHIINVLPMFAPQLFAGIVLVHTYVLKVFAFPNVPFTTLHHAIKGVDVRNTLIYAPLNTAGIHV